MTEDIKEHNYFCLKSTKILAKTLLVIFALSAVFSCCFAAIVLHFGKEFGTNAFPLLCCLAAFPLIVFIVVIVKLLLCSRCSKDKEKTNTEAGNA